MRRRNRRVEFYVFLCALMMGLILSTTSGRAEKRAAIKPAPPGVFELTGIPH